MNRPVSMHGNSIFVLIHGATGSQNGWARVQILLESLGHVVYCPNLPGHGPDTRDITKQNISTYADDVAEFIRQLNRPVILVGHSMGGTVISAIGERVPEKIEKIVYLAAWMLEDGMSCNGVGTSYEPHNYHLSEDGILVKPYQMGDELPEVIPEIADVRRRESIAALHEPIHITKERWGSIRRFYIKTMKDTAIQTWKQEMMIEKLPCERVYELNTGHGAPGENPVELAFILHDISRA